ncbi:hypothetical protein ACQKOM_25060 [Peribacillus frigoritolerans]|uniref:hypothetical protein n=1 Tax=Peribacillus frigoritolerans TaxID=450367 RepID=UPI003CFD7E64
MDILSHFNKLSLHTINLLEQKRYIEFQENSNTFFHLFQYSLQKSSNPNNSKLIASLSDNIIDLGKDALNKGFIDEAKYLVIQLLDSLQNNSNTFEITDRISNGIIDLGKNALSKGFIDEALDIVKELLDSLRKNSSSNNLKITDKISDNVIDLGKRALNHGLIKETIQLTIHLLDTSINLKNDKQIEYKPYMFDLITEIVKTVSKQNDITLIHTIRNFLYKITTQEVFIHQDLMYYYSSYYYSLSQNKIIENDDKDSLITSLINNVISNLRYPQENKIQLYKNIIYFMIRQFIKSSKHQYFSYLLNELYNSSKHTMKDYIYEIFVTVSIYLYYISFKENYYSDMFKNEAKQLLNNRLEEKISTRKTFNLRNFIINSDGYFWKFYTDTKNELVNGDWEHVPYHDAKWMHMERDLREFYIFYTFLTTSSFYFNSVALQKFESNELRVLSEFFEPDHQLKINYHGGLLEFLEWFNENNNEDKHTVPYMNKINNKFIGEQIINAYKQTVFEDLLSYNQEEEAIKKKQQVLISELKKSIETSTFSNFSSLPTNICSEDTKTINISRFIPIPIGYLAEKVQFFNFEPDKIILNEVELEVLTSLSPKLEKLEFEFNDSNKVEKLFNTINALKKHAVDINSLIKDFNEDSILLSYYENKKSTEALHKLEEKLLDLGHFAYLRNTLYLDNKMICINFTNCEFFFRDVNDDDIHGDLKDSKVHDDLYRINTTNDLHIELTHNEATMYFKNSYKILEAKLEVKVSTSSKVGILISYKT